MKTIKQLLKTKFKNWYGFLSLMEGGWRRLPIRIDPNDIKDVIKDEEALSIVSKEIRDALKKYSFKISDIEYFSMLCDGSLVVKMATTKPKKTS